MPHASHQLLGHRSAGFACAGHDNEGLLSEPLGRVQEAHMSPKDEQLLSTFGCTEMRR